MTARTILALAGVAILAAPTLADDKVIAPPAPATAPSAQPASKPDATPAKPAKPATPPPATPTLDDLLGITDKPAASPTDKPAADQPTVAPATTTAPPDPSRAELDRLLSAQEMGDAFKQAIALMDDAAVRLKDHADPRLETQRVQEDVLRRLDQLLASLDNQQSSSSSSSSSSSGQQQPGDPKNDPGSKKGQKPGDAKQPGQPQHGDGNADHAGPTLKEGELSPAIESARAAWGSLPARVRDSLMQGSADRFSARYKALTEEYYKRLAEEAGK